MYGIALANQMAQDMINKLKAEDARQSAYSAAAGMAWNHFLQHSPNAMAAAYQVDPQLGMNLPKVFTAFNWGSFGGPKIEKEGPTLSELLKGTGTQQAEEIPRQWSVNPDLYKLMMTSKQPQLQQIAPQANPYGNRGDAVMNALYNQQLNLVPPLPFDQRIDSRGQTAGQNFVLGGS